MRAITLAAAAFALAPAAHAVTVYTDRAAFDAATGWTGTLGIDPRKLVHGEGSNSTYADAHVTIGIVDADTVVASHPQYAGQSQTLRIRADGPDGVVSFGSRGFGLGFHMSTGAEPYGVTFHVGDASGTFTSVVPDVGFLGFVGDNSFSGQFSLAGLGGRGQTILINKIVITPFYGAAAPPSAVPEPATWGLMILGFGLVGASVRRRTGARAVTA